MSDTTPHLVIIGSQVSTHENHADARAAAIAQAKRGVVATVAQLVETIQPNTGVVVTDAAGNSTVLKD